MDVSSSCSEAVDGSGLISRFVDFGLSAASSSVWEIIEWLRVRARMESATVEDATLPARPARPLLHPPRDCPPRVDLAAADSSRVSITEG